MLRRLSCLILCLSLCLCTCCAISENASPIRGYDKKEGYQYISFGTYPTDADGTLRPILWRVLKSDGDTAYLLSEYILEASQIHSDRRTYESWETCDLFKYLNSVFLRTAFTEEEQSLLVCTTEDGGLVTLITADEMQDKSLGFTNNNARKCLSTAYAKTTGLYIYSKGHRYSPWWSRTRSTSNLNQQRRVMDEGKTGRIDVQAKDLGTRPAISIDLDRAVILSGSGTLEDPLILTAAETDMITTQEDNP